MISENILILLSYFESLEQEQYYGTIEITLNGGKFIHSRELRSRQAYELALEKWETFPKEVQKEIEKRFKNKAQFQEKLRNAKKTNETT